VKAPVRKVPQYVGSLSPHEVAAGINAARLNAKRLAEDARALLDGRRFPSALALAILSIEETGKASILRSIGLASTEAELKKAWREYRSHKSKNALWAAFDAVEKGARKLDDFAPIFDPSSDHPQVLDELKQLALYTECVRADKWSEPVTVVDEDLAKSIVAIAAAFVTERITSPEELEIYFRHIGPVRNGNPAWIKQAFIKAYAEMQERGIRPPGTNEAEDLVNGRIGVRNSTTSKN